MNQQDKWNSMDIVKIVFGVQELASGADGKKI